MPMFYNPYYMRLALTLAEQAVGRTAENPAVGCVVVKNGAVIGHGATARDGRPHAETQALEKAGSDAEGADIYVTLEPCSHTGKTPPCADALVQARPARLFIAEIDPDSRVSGRGIARCRAGGIDTYVIHDAKICYPHAAFTFSVRNNRPYIALKTAMTADGYSAAASGDSKWITGSRARLFGHRLRAEACAIIIGAETAICDDPLLTCRLPGRTSDSPVRIILDPFGRVPPSSAMLQEGAGPEVFMVRGTGNAVHIPDSHYETCAARTHIIHAPYNKTRRCFDIGAMLRLPYFEHMRSILVEGGGKTLASFIEAGYADTLYMFRAPLLLGSSSRPAMPIAGVSLIADAYMMRETAHIRLGPDRLSVFVRR